MLARSAPPVRRPAHHYLDLGAGIRLAYTVDEFTDPWAPSETVLLVHGLAESGEAWFGWVPHLARKYRVVRMDMRGFGASTPMLRDFAWSLDLLADDLDAMVAHIGGPVHLVGAKIGATVCVAFAARHPERLRSLTLIGLPVVGSRNRPGVDMERFGVRAWARSSMEERLGADSPPALIEWWSDLMGATALSTLAGFSDAVGDFDVTGDLARIACPTLALNSDSARHPVAKAEAWRACIPRSELVVVPGEGYHAAARYPDFCAQATLRFLDTCAGT